MSSHTTPRTTFDPAVSLALAAYDSFNQHRNGTSDVSGAAVQASNKTSCGVVVAGAFVYALLPGVALIETVAKCLLALPIMLISWTADCCELIDMHDREHWFNKYIADPIVGGLYFGEMALFALWTALYFNFKDDKVPNSRELMDKVCPCSFNNNYPSDLLAHYAPQAAH